jgi:hypothetical protein
MSNDDEIQSQVIEDEKSTHIQMDSAFSYACGHSSGPRKRADWRHHHAGTKNPKYFSELTARYHRLRNEL